MIMTKAASLPVDSALFNMAEIYSQPMRAMLTVPDGLFEVCHEFPLTNNKIRGNPFQNLGDSFCDMTNMTLSP